MGRIKQNDQLFRSRLFRMFGQKHSSTGTILTTIHTIRCTTCSHCNMPRLGAERIPTQKNPYLFINTQWLCVQIRGVSLSHEWRSRPDLFELVKPVLFHILILSTTINMLIVVQQDLCQHEVRCCCIPILCILVLRVKSVHELSGQLVY